MEKCIQLIGRNFIMQQDNDPKHTANTTKDFIREKKWKVLDWPSQSPDLTQVSQCTLSMHFTSWRGDWRENPPKHTTTERGCSKSLEKHHKRRMQQFGDVNVGRRLECSYCKKGICYQILSVIYFHLLKCFQDFLFQYFCSPKNWVVWYQRCYVLSRLTHLGVNTRK